MINAEPRALELRGISKTFASRGQRLEVLRDVDLEVRPGSFVSIVGPSGSGKSTLFNIASGLLAPSAGRVLLDGDEPRSLLGQVGYMPQADALFPWRTIVDNVGLGLELSGYSKKASRERATALLREFGLADFAKSYPRELSGGMRSRAAFIRTILAQRGVMLLDEPFGALDSITRSEVQDWLLGAWGGHRSSILFITHDVAEAVYLSDYVYVLSARPGRIAAGFEIDLPRPRSQGMIGQGKFYGLVGELKETLGEAASPRHDQLQAAGL